MKFYSFFYPTCIKVCNGSAKCVDGYWPEIASIKPDRTIQWKRKRITQEMRDYVENLANTPYLKPFDTAEYNFFNCEPIK